MFLPIIYQTRRFFFGPLFFSFLLSSFLVGIIEIFAHVFFSYNIFGAQTLLILMALNIPVFIIIYLNTNRVRSIIIADDYIALNYTRFKKITVKVLTDQILYVEICVPVNNAQPYTFNVFATPELYHQFTDAAIPLPDFIAYLKERNVSLIYNPEQISPTAKSF